MHWTSGIGAAGRLCGVPEPPDGDGQTPRQHAASGPVDDGGQIDEASLHGDVGDIHRPDRGGSSDG